MSNYMYFVLQHTETFETVELKGCIDTETIDNAEPVVEYVDNNGLWNCGRPDYCMINGTNYSMELDFLKETEAYEWDVISQILVDVEDSVDEVFKYQFKDVDLYVSYLEDFDKEEMILLPSREVMKNDFRRD